MPLLRPARTSRPRPPTYGNGRIRTESSCPAAARAPGRTRIGLLGCGPPSPTLRSGWAAARRPNRSPGRFLVRRHTRSDRSRHHRYDGSPSESLGEPTQMPDLHPFSRCQDRLSESSARMKVLLNSNLFSLPKSTKSN